MKATKPKEKRRHMGVFPWYIAKRVCVMDSWCACACAHGGFLVCVCLCMW